MQDLLKDYCDLLDLFPLWFASHLVSEAFKEEEHIPNIDYLKDHYVYGFNPNFDCFSSNLQMMIQKQIHTDYDVLTLL